jgi:hypothetical protein
VRVLLVGPVVVNFPHAAELSFKRGLEEAGAEVVTLDPNVPGQEVPRADAVLVFKNAYDYNDRISEVAPIRILYQPDDARYPHIGKMLQEMRPHCDHLLAFDVDSAKLGQQTCGYRLAEEMLLTADPGLYRPIDVVRDLDFVFVGSTGDPYAHMHRRSMVDYLRGWGYKVTVSHEHDPTEVSRLYSRARVVLNHATNVGQKFGQGFGWQQRHFEAAMAGACVLSNENNRGELQYWHRFSSVEGLRLLAKGLMNGDLDARHCAQKLRENVLTHHSPLVRGRQILDFIARCS